MLLKVHGAWSFLCGGAMAPSRGSRALTWAVGVWLALWAGSSPARAGEEPPRPPQRWAIIASPPVEKTGLPDLLTADLSARKNTELVERARIRDVTRELALSQALGPATSGRLKLGRLLRADRLAILVKGQTAKPSIHLVICDCRTGARLWHGVFPSEDVTAVRAAIRDRIGRVAAQHSTGKLRVIGLSPFKSNNLVHDYDHLQASFAHLLASALLAVPNVAVVETEEAAAIAGEQAEGVERTVPLFVKGSFIVVNAVTKKDVTFTVEVVLTRGPRTLATVRREKVPLREVARFLRREVAPRVLKEAGKQAGQPLAEAEQVKELVARADVFTRVGDWSHAAGLREAALLLDPDSVEQRVQLLHEYDRIASQEIYEVGLKPVTAESIGSIDWGSPALVRAVRRRADAASARLAHVEYLVRNKLLDAHRAMDLIVGMRLWTIIGHVPRLHACELGPTGLRAKALGPAATAGETFALKIVPLVLGLPRGKKKARFEESLLTRWSESMMRRLRYRLDLGYARKEDLDHMAWLYGELLPQKLSSQMLVRLPPVDGPSLKSAKTVSYGGSVFSMDDWRSFLRKLERSKSDVVRAFGRFCEIRWEWTIHQHIKAKSVSELKGLLKQADALQAELGRLGFRFRGYPLAETVSYVPNRVHFMRRDLCLALKLHPPIRPGGDPVATAGTLPSREKGTGRLLFERLDVQLRTQDGKRVPFEQNRLRMSPAGDRQATLLRCTNKLDVLWDETFILIMRTKGLFEELPHTGEPSFTDVKWDGESIWVGTRRQGVWVLAPSGKVKAKITAKQGLPPCDVKVLLHPIGKDRALAVGSFGGQRRGWCAVIEKKGDTYSVKVFLRATEAAIGDRIANPVVDLKRAFEPAWLHELDTGDKNQRILLVGRRASRRQVMYPLRIDLHTLNVSHLPIRMKTGVFSRAFYSENGRLFESRNWHVAYWTGRDCHWKDEREEEVRFICRSPGKYSRYQLVPYNGRLYVPNDVWFRFDPATLKVERLVPGRLPEKYIMWYTAVSGHYGLVTWGGNHALHRITLKETDRDEEDPN